MDFDVILKDVGEFGRYQQLLLVFVLLPACLPAGFHGFSQIFLVATPGSFSCRIPYAAGHNLSRADVELFLPKATTDGKLVVSQCEMYDLDYKPLFSSGRWKQMDPNISAVATVIPCRYGWDYNRSVYESTVVMEWDLVCDKSLLPTVSLGINTFGTFVGSLLFGYLGDKIGRKKAFFISAMLQLFTGILTVLSPNFVIFCIIRFFNGLTIAPAWVLPLILGLEIIGPSKRAPAGVTMSIFYTLGVVGLAGMACLIRHWVYLQLAVTLPFIVFVSYWWLLPESPRWLLAQDRLQEMTSIVEKIARVNGVLLTDGYMAQIQEQIKHAKNEETEKKTYHLFDLFKTPNLRKKTVLIVFSTFSSYVVYNGLTFSAPHLGDEEHLSFLLGALIEVPSYFVLYFTLDRLGRRLILMSTMVIAGTLCITAALATNMDQVYLILLFLGSKFSITISFFVTDLFASELFPTVVRGAGISLTQTVSAIGLCISPIITHFAKHYLSIPLTIFGVLAIAGGVATMILPETAAMKLPESLLEGEEFGKCTNWKEWFRLMPVRQKTPYVRRASEELKQRRSLSVTKVLLGDDAPVPFKNSIVEE